MRVFGGIEGGGTKFVCAVGTGPEDMRARAEFPTTSPRRPSRARWRFSASTAGGGGGHRLVRPRGSEAGRITSTPKPGWANTDFAGAVRRALGVPVGFDTDTNGAALAERRWGAAQGLDTFIYLTVGTGIGGGGMVNGRLMHGLMHPEVGHIRIPHDRAADPFPGAARTTAIASRAWPPGRPSRRAGAAAGRRCRRTIPPGSWRQATWRWGS